MSSDPDRTSSYSGSNPDDIKRGEGISLKGPSTKLINLIIHDAAQGIGSWVEAVNSEIYGCIIYNNGWQGPDRGHGHGIYIQNSQGTKYVSDNVIFNQFDKGIQIYGSGDTALRGIQLRGNTLLRNGILSPSNDSIENLTIYGGATGPEGILVNDNMFYGPSFDGNLTVGGEGAKDLIFQNNYIANRTRILYWQTATVSGNSFLRDSVMVNLWSTKDPSSLGYYWDKNMYTSAQTSDSPFVIYRVSSTGSITGSALSFSGWRSATKFDASSQFNARNPSGTRVFIRPNKYEKGRATIVVYNWDRLSSVGVNLSSVLASGQTFEIRNAQNYFASPVVTGTYSGQTISLPMTGLAVATPVGKSAPTGTGPEFNVFVVRVTGQSSTTGTSGVPAAPTGLKATPSDTKIALSWSSSSGASGYYVKRTKTSGGTFSKIATVSGTTYTDSGLVNGTTYYYTVSAYNSSGESSNSSTVSAVPGTQTSTSPTTESPSTGAPAAPTSITAVAGDSQAALSWPSSSGASGYYVKRTKTDGGTFSTIATVSGTTFTDRGLVNGRTYYYVVAAFNSNGSSANSPQVKTVPGSGQTTTSGTSSSTPTTSGAPATPTGLKGTSGDTKGTLTWSSVSGASGYYVKRTKTVGGTFNRIATVSSATYTDTGLVNGTTYYYVVSAFNSYGESPNSGSVSIVPGSGLVSTSGETISSDGGSVPTGVTAEPGDSRIELQWLSVTGATSYNVSRSKTDGGPHSTVATVNSPSYVDTGLVNGRTYYYVVSAIVSGVETANSAQVSATPSPEEAGAAFLGFGQGAVEELLPVDDGADDARLRISRRSPGVVLLNFDGLATAGTYDLEASSDLVRWSAIDEMEVTAGQGTIAIEISGGGPQRFYRLVPRQ